MSGRVLRAGVVVGNDQQVGVAGRELAHQWALGAVAVAAAAEDDDQPAGGERAQCAERALDGGRLVA